MIIGLIILFIILCFIFSIACSSDYKREVLWLVMSLVSFGISVVISIVGGLHGFINYKPTEGIHQGVITSVDLEGTYFRRYECYLKSSGYTNQSDETKYLLYDYEKDLAEELQNAIGKTVKIHYGHDGGYIAWNSCGTYHIKSIEIIDEE